MNYSVRRSYPTTENIINISNIIPQSSKHINLDTSNHITYLHVHL